MDHIYITDIFGNNIEKGDNNVPFIIIHTMTPNTYLAPIEKNVFQVIYPNIVDALNIYGIDKNSYAPMGNILLLNIAQKVSFPMVNTNTYVSQYPIDFIKIGYCGEKSVWKPIGTNKYVALGYIISFLKPKNISVRVVHEKYVNHYKGKTITFQNLVNMNEFNLLGYLQQLRYTINRIPLTSENKNNIKIYSPIYDGYLNYKNDTVGLSRYGNLVKYDKGHIMFGDRCLESTNTSLTVLSSCKDTPKQEWFVADAPHQATQKSHRNLLDEKALPVSEVIDDSSFSYDSLKRQSLFRIEQTSQQNHLVSNYDLKCLTANINGTIYKDTCDERNIEQKWKLLYENDPIENLSQKSNHPWVTQEGKRVILVEADDPWFINISEDMDIETISRTSPTTDEQSINVHDKFTSNFIMNTHSPNLGYGYSYLDRLGTEQNDFGVIEDFNKKKTTNNDITFNIFIYTFLIVVAFLIIYRFSKKNNNTSN